MRIDREAFLADLEAIKPGLTPAEVLIQSSCFAFLDGLVWTYNDLVCCNVPSKLGNSFTGAVPAQPLLTQLGKLAESEVDIRLSKDGKELLILGKGKKETGITMENKVMLEVSKVDRPKEWHPLPKEFSEGVKLVKDCGGSDKSKPMYTVVRWHPKWLEAADGFQMMRFKVDAPTLQEPALIKRDAIQHVSNLGMTKFSITNAWVHFRNPAKLVMSCRKQIGIEFENLSKFLNKEGGQEVSLPKGLEAACNLCNTFAAENKDHSLVKVTLSSSGSKIEAKGVSGRHEQPIKGVGYKGPNMTFLAKPELLGQLVKKHSDFTIAEGWIRAKGPRFTFLARLWRPEALQT